MDIRKFYDLIDNGVGQWIAENEAECYGVDKIETPKKIEFIHGSYYHKQFYHLAIIPSIDYYVDKQMEKGFTYDKTLYKGFKSYSLIISWLFWFVEVQINIVTDKMEK